MKKEEVLDLTGDFTYCFGCDFFIETPQGNFVWRCPDYPNGDNSLEPFQGNLKDFLAEAGVSHGRSKGTHKIREYCGNDVVLA